MPIGWQLQWFDITCNTLLNNHILMSKAFEMLENVHIAKAKGDPMVSFQTYSFYVKKILAYRYQKGIPRDVNFYLDQAHTIIDAEGWSYDFVHRQSNMPADFLANYAKGLNKKGDLDQANPLFRDDILPMRLKEIFINDQGMFHVIVKLDPTQGCSTGVKFLTATNTIQSNNATIQHWTNGMCDYFLFFF